MAGPCARVLNAAGAAGAATGRRAGPQDDDGPRPVVSVLMPVFNAAPYLAEAIESVLQQRYRSFELAVVDDGSTDDSSEIAFRYSRQAPDRVRVLRQANAGLPSARNSAIAMARGDYFALLDADDRWRPEHLGLAMAAFDADPDVGLVHANIRRIDAQGQPIDVPRRRWDHEPDAYVALALRREHVACPTAVFSRDCVRSVGGFDTQFTGLGCEDRDLWLRIAERYRVHYLDVVVADYRVHAGGMSRQQARMASARLRLLHKVGLSTRGAPLYAHMQAMLESDRGLELLQDGQWWPALRAQLQALDTRPQTWQVWRRLLRIALLGSMSGGVPMPRRSGA